MTTETTTVNNTLNLSLVEELVAERGLTIVEQSAFYKIATAKKAIYVGKTKKAITRVDISGFDVAHPAVRPPMKKNGKVTGQIVIGHESALDALRLALDLLADPVIIGDRHLLGDERARFESKK